MYITYPKYYQDFYNFFHKSFRIAFILLFNKNLVEFTLAIWLVIFIQSIKVIFVLNILIYIYKKIFKIYNIKLFYINI